MGLASLTRLLRLRLRVSDEQPCADQPGGAPGAERRSEPRLPCRANLVTCRYAAGHVSTSWWSPRIRNVSANGLGLIQKRSVAAGAPLTIELACLDQAFSRSRAVRVVHVTPAGDEWLVGCALLAPFTAAELEVLVAPPFTERRMFVRHACLLEAECFENEAVEYGSGWPVTVLNISQGGVCLRTRQRLTPGTVLILGLGHTCQGFRPPMVVRVVQVTDHTEGAWLLGCEFNRLLGLDELHALLA
jgi:hypothetical protein